jgi:thioredoxin 1
MTFALRCFSAALLLALTLVVSADASFVTEFEIAGMSCGGCESTAADALRKVRGVTNVTVAFATRRARVESTRRIEEAELRAALAKPGFEARFPTDPVVAAMTAEERSRLDIRVASRGEAFDIRANLAPGKYTIFDFWAEWCGPCHVLTPKIERLVQERSNVALRTIDLQQWDSAAARQATKEFKLPGLPYVRVYGPDGKLVGEVVGNDIEKIKRLVRRGE